MQHSFQPADASELLMKSRKIMIKILQCNAIIYFTDFAVVWVELFKTETKSMLKYIYIKD